MDGLTKARRSENMRRIKSQDTKPEMVVRRLVHGMGYRYRLHVRDLSGKPDLVFASRQRIIFVHGCFWHQHKGCVDSHIPNSRQSYWLPKLTRNVERDKQHLSVLRKAGWKCLIVWECETQNPIRLSKRITGFLGE
jgi:DNA mismatch endonuclease (patch repair protein)